MTSFLFLEVSAFYFTCTCLIWQFSAVAFAMSPDASAGVSTSGYKSLGFVFSVCTCFSFIMAPERKYHNEIQLKIHVKITPTGASLSQELAKEQKFIQDQASIMMASAKPREFNEDKWDDALGRLGLEVAKEGHQSHGHLVAPS